MPEISRFYGIIIYLLWKDQNPPHIYFSYGDYECVVNILDGIVDGKPNDKLKIDGKKYVISLGDVSYDAQTGIVIRHVLADGQRLPNTTRHASTTVDVGNGRSWTSKQSSQPVSMSLIVDGRTIFFHDMLSTSDDGIFEFMVEAAPEKISLYTGIYAKEHVYFDGKPKAIISA